MELKDRLKIFIDCFYKNNKQFSEQSDIYYSSLCKYLKGNISPTEDSLLKFYKAGINVCWLLSGEGSMFASNEKGTEFRMKHDESNPEYGIEMMKNRIRNWINKNYNSIKEFTEEMNVELGDVENELKDYYSSSPMFLTLIEKAGCNLDWVVTGKGNVYSNNPRGFIFQYKKEGKEIKNDNITEEGIDPQLKVFYDLIRKAVRDEMKKNEKEKK
ncbi:MAG: hypothetical protein V1779_10955 [bacterium]